MGKGWWRGCVLGLLFAGGSSAAWAGPPRLPDPIDRPEAMPSVEDAETIAAAVRLLDARARIAFDEEKFGVAAEQWEHAHALLGMTPGLDVERQEIAFHLAHAQIHANSADNDPQRLERARTLLWGYVAHLQRPDHTPTAEERERIDRATELIEIVEYRVRDARARETVARPYAAAVPNELPPRRRARLTDEARARGLIGGGLTGLALGVVSVAVGGAVVNGGRPGQGSAALGVGGALFAAGAVTFGVGVAELRRVRAQPLAGRGVGGVALAGRF